MAVKEREDTSKAEGGRGQASLYVTRLSKLNVPYVVGRSPGSGVNCTVSLQINGDHAYDGAVVQFYAEQMGRFGLFDSHTITIAEVNANPTLLLSTGTCAADSWEVYVTLTGATLPAKRLNGAVAAFGVEMAGLGGGGGGTYTGAAPIEVTGTVISIDPAYTPWRQVGGVGGVIEAIDPTASLEAGGGVSSGPLTVAFMGATAIGSGSFAVGAFGYADGTAAFAGGGGYAAADYAAAFSNSTALLPYDFAAAGGYADGGYSVALGFNAGTAAMGAFAANYANANGVYSAAFASGLAAGVESFAGTQAQANGDFSFAMQGFANANNSVALGDGATTAGAQGFAGAGGFADAINSVSFQEGSSSAGGSDFTVGGGQSLGPFGFAAGGYAGVSGASYDVAFGAGSTADGGLTFAVGGGQVSASQGFAHGQGQAVAQGAVALNQMLAREPWAFAAGVPGTAAIEVGNDLTGTAVNITAGLFSIFGAPAVPQQLGGAMTAGPVYTAVEQGMIQTAYSALIAFGFLSP